MLSTQRLVLSIGTRRLLSGLDWELAAGQCWCVLGRNGAGKSTLLRTLAGLRAPDGGAVSLQGRALDAWPLPELARQRAYLAQSHSDSFSYTAFEVVLAARHPFQGGRWWEGEADHRAAWDALRALDVDGLAGRDVRTLSGGERQRVAIAAMLAQDTPLLLLDEPANALDLAHQVSVMALLGRLCRECGKAAVMVGHDLNLARGVASHVLLLMADGGWHAGPVAEVMQAGLLGECLGHPIEAFCHGGRTVFVPLEAV